MPTCLSSVFRRSPWKLLTTILCGLPLILLTLPGRAACSRPIQVPVAVAGLNVMFKNNRYSGIMPDFLSLIEANSNCRFVYFYVPKNRQEKLFEGGKADLLIATVRTARRDKLGSFVPLVQLRAAVISIVNQQPVIRTPQDLYERDGVRLVVVRGYDYGAGYQGIVEHMHQLGRLIIETDPVSAARLMMNNPRYVTIMAPTLLSGVVQTEVLLKPMVGKLHYDTLDELPWTASGIYISHSALSSSDQHYLKAQLDKYAATDVVRKSYLQVYPPEVVKLGLRARDAIQ